MMENPIFFFKKATLMSQKHDKTPLFLNALHFNMVEVKTVILEIFP